jgi:hypothetical protein
MKQDRIVDRVVREVKVGGRGKAKSKSTALTTEAQRSQRLHGESGVDGGAGAEAMARQVGGIGNSGVYIQGRGGNQTPRQIIETGEGGTSRHESWNIG